MSDLKPFAEWAALITEVIGLAVILILAVYSLASAVIALLRRVNGHEVFCKTRHRLTRGVLLGLEFLVAADIIHTAAVEFSFTSVGVLASIVAIRTFLSFTLELEMTGHWPWQHDETLC